MKYSKPALLYEEQIDLLISRGMICPNRGYALDCLRRIGYYRLSPYFKVFLILGVDDFRTGITFENVVRLYEFDADLRALVMKAIAKIEIAARTSITYRMAHEYGVFGYANSDNFELFSGHSDPLKPYRHGELLEGIKREEGRSQEIFVKHFRTTYTDETYLPLWMATELISFSTLSRMYAHLRSKMRKEIADDFGQPELIFVSWLHALVGVRNICAHHGRLWNRNLGVKPAIPDVWKQWSPDNSGFYMMALIFQSVLDQVAPQFAWKEQLKTLLNDYSEVDLRRMRFPSNWQLDMRRYK